VRESREPVRSVALIVDPRHRIPLGSLLEPGLAFCDRVESLLALASSSAVRVVITEPYDANGVGVSAALAEIAGAPGAPEIILLLDPTQRAIQQVEELLELGVALRLALRDDRGAHAIDSARRDVTGQRAQQALIRRTLPFIAPPLRPFFAACGLLAGDRIRVSHVARVTGLATRTLEARLAKAGYPRARTIAAWYRVLFIAWRLDIEGHTVKQLVGSGDSGLHARRALGNLVRRHTGQTLSSLGAPGAFAALLHRFLTQLGASLRKSSILDDQNGVVRGDRVNPDARTV